MKKINFICFLDGNTGYSVLSRSLISLMHYAGLDLSISNLHRVGVPGFEDLQAKDPNGRFDLLHQIPTVKPDADGFYTVTEFDQPTYGSISPIRNAKLILTESNFCKEVFSKFTDAPIHVIHYPVDPQYRPQGSKIEFNPELEHFGFKFLSVFEWIMRKDPYTLIEAFVEEFDKDEDVCLMLRTWSKFRNPNKWIGKLAKDHNVFWLPQDVNNMPALYRAADCFVTSTLGEGFGHPILEAMACGLKVIAPDSTGIRDFLTTKNGLPINVKEEEVGDRFNEIPHLIKPWFKCYPPDKEELKKAMRRAFSNDMNFIKQNAVKVREQYSFDNIIKEIKEAFEIGA